MSAVSTYTNGNRKAEVYNDITGGFTVSYYIDERLIQKSHHIDQQLAEDLADDFVVEGGSSPQFLSD
jgi:hypothetical protein